MLSKKMNDALNAQINAEMWSAYLYLSMSVNAAAKGHKGVANWVRDTVPRGAGPCANHD